MTMFQDPQTALLRSPVYGIVIGQFIGLDAGCRPLVMFPGQTGTAAIPARTTVPPQHIPMGTDIVLQFDQGDVAKPVVLGVIQTPDRPMESLPAEKVQRECNGKRLLVSAQDEIVLRCGDASITLTRAGKVLINGTYVSSRAKGTHRIKGGNVQIN